MKPQNSSQHTSYQKDYFDANVDFFRQPIPLEIQERTVEIVNSAALRKSMQVLDVATGVGVLIPYFLKAGIEPSSILGVDLSAEMLSEAKKNYPDVGFWQGDILEYPLSGSPFDAVFLNACFGNFFDQFAVLKHCRALLSATGKIVISHPLGNSFVLRLKEQDPRLVLALLPDKTKLEAWAGELNLVLQQYRDEEELYLALLEVDRN
ncbi:MAG: class I SAM-dependent methyltransferase [Candidatus Obscuribacterales bacterium]|jgi:ubiquinone/menaquinone biosynthesis C-methylase UbiE|nr:class I SAM-dependent methyltransferase [Candidatus Obscuribacterales bacterium]